MKLTVVLGGALIAALCSSPVFAGVIIVDPVPDAGATAALLALALGALGFASRKNRR